MEAALFQARPVGSLSENSSDSTDVWGWIPKGGNGWRFCDWRRSRRSRAPFLN
jgi:hypothetical protein